MALNHGKLMEALDGIAAKAEAERFIYDFLSAYGIAQSTLTRLRQGGDRNVGEREGDVGLRQKLYFRPVAQGEDPFAVAEALKASDAVARHRIRFIVVTDFQDLVAHDLVADDVMDCALTDLSRHYSFFLPLAGYEKARTYEESVADVKAAEKMGRLCDIIRKENDLSSAEDLHALNVFLTRVLFCLFAEDTGIFGKNLFTDTLKGNTRADGADVDTFLEQLFEILNTERRPAGCPAHLAAFPYVNGGLFRESLPVPAMGKRARRYLLDAGTLDWSQINPDIFGSMFQAVIDPEQRGSLGQHYTSVSNIMKVIRPLFLDKLEAELERSRGSRKRLERLLTRLQSIKVFDPACGSGNFLIVAYKELRRIEMAVFEAMEALSGRNAGSAGGQREIFMSGIRLSQFHGIEIDDFAHEIALLALWLAEHQMNIAFENQFGYAEPLLPLRSSGAIIKGNALRMDWSDVCSGTGEQEIYICSNPPFLGSKGTNSRDDSKKQDMAHVFGGARNSKSLDYVASWIFKGAKYITSKRREARAAFVATTSIFQGEQVSALWPGIFNLGAEIEFAYQSFVWQNSAHDNAGVHVGVVGLSSNADEKSLFRMVDGQWCRTRETGISPYLIAGGNTVAFPRTRPFLGAATMKDGNNYTKSEPLTLSPEEKDRLVRGEPQSKKWIRRLIGADEFLNGKERWCLWLVNASDDDFSGMSLVKERVNRVYEDRIKSKKKSTREVASKTPHLFAEIRQPSAGEYIVVPRVTSERRQYVPIGFEDYTVISTNQNLIIPGGELYEFAMLCSEFHMDWLRLVGGRLESRYRYSAKLVYNTFPWPEVTDNQRKEIERLGEEILLVREETYDWTMAQMYDPDRMPPRLREAHAALDRAVERLYRDKPFRDRAERQEYLLARYQELIEAEQSGHGRSTSAQGAS